MTIASGNEHGRNSGSRDERSKAQPRIRIERGFSARQRRSFQWDARGRTTCCDKNCAAEGASSGNFEGARRSADEYASARGTGVLDAPLFGASRGCHRRNRGAESPLRSNWCKNGRAPFTTSLRASRHAFPAGDGNLCDAVVGRVARWAGDNLLRYELRSGRCSAGCFDFGASRRPASGPISGLRNWRRKRRESSTP